MSEPWLTKKEVADLLKVSTKTIERVNPPCLRVGGQNRYRMSEVEKALRTNPVAPDRIEVLLTLTPEEYQELGASLQAIREQSGRSPGASSTELILESAALMAQRAEAGENAPP